VSGRLGGIHFSPVPAVKLPFCWVFDARPAIRQICRTTFRRRNDFSHLQNDFSAGKMTTPMSKMTLPTARLLVAPENKPGLWLKPKLRN
jgi:hypothetical protein